jgi:fructokinase
MVAPNRPPVLVWGEVLWDRFPTGRLLGGAPANVAWHLAMLGTPVALASRVGDDEDGREACRRLAARGVAIGLVQRDGARATGEVAVRLAAGEPRYRLVPGRAWEAIEATAAARAAAARAPALVFGTLAQRTARGRAAWREVVAACGPATLRVCDPNLRPGHFDGDAVAAALEVADVVKLGEPEQAAIERQLGRADLVDWLLGVRRPAARLVAVTRGPAGSTLCTATARLEVAATPAAPGGDHVGCGDAYVAVLTRGLIEGWPLVEVGAAASRWAAAVAGVRGATPDLDPALIAGPLRGGPGAPP